jgi:hypothetical protein
MFGSRLAWITADPGATPVTTTVVLVPPAAMVAVAGTVAAAALLDETFSVTPPDGAGADKVKVRLRVAVPTMVTLFGVKLTVAFTCTAVLAGVYPSALAVTVALPSPTPVATGCGFGAVAPAAIVTVAGTVTRPGFELSRDTVTPPAGAGAGSVTVNCPVWLRFTERFAAIPNAPALCTVTVAVAFGTVAIPVLAVIGAVPSDTPVTATTALVPPAAIVTLPGTVATAGFPEVRLTTSPPAGAGDDRRKVTFWVVRPAIVGAAGSKLRAAPTVTVAFAVV